MVFYFPAGFLFHTLLPVNKPAAGATGKLGAVRDIRQSRFYEDHLLHQSTPWRFQIFRSLGGSRI